MRNCHVFKAGVLLKEISFTISRTSTSMLYSHSLLFTFSITNDFFPLKSIPQYLSLINVLSVLEKIVEHLT